MEISKVKQTLRKVMALRKKEYTTDRLLELSVYIMERLEQTSAFRNADCIALYHALPGEVQTEHFIEKWYKKKRLLLPIVENRDLKLVPYTGKESVKPGAFGIMEPICSNETTNENNIDLIIVPGIAFDRQRNRMGRGKGFYDRLLSTLSATKIGICFDFQLLDEIPMESFDRKMDKVITENEII